VAKNGSDSNNGSKELPFYTVRKGINTLTNGDSLYIREGIYREYLEVSFDAVENAPIFISGYPGEQAVIDGSEKHSNPSWPWNADDILCYVRGDYTTINNLEVKNAASFGIYVRANHVTLENIYAHNCYLAGIYFYKCSYGIARNCILHDFYDYDEDGTGGGGNADGLGSSAGNSDDYLTIEYGYHLFENNIVFNASDDCIDTWTSRYNTIRNNIIRHSGYSNPSNGGSKSIEVLEGDGNGFKLGKGGYNSVLFNVAYDVPSRGFDSNSGNNLILYNNTSFDCNKYNFCMYDDSLIINNNISFQGAICNFPADAVDEYNTWNLNINNPDFISTDPYSPLFLHLSSSSPAIDKGTDLGYSFNGAAPDLGAYEYGDTAINSGFNTTLTAHWTNTATMAVAAADNYIYFGNGDYFEVAELTAEGTLLEKGKVVLMNVMRDIAVNGDYAYIAEGSNGLRIINITDPKNPVKVGLYNTGGFAYGVAVSGTKAYIADADAGLRIIDVSDPANPAELSFYKTDGYAHAVTLKDDYAYIAVLWGGVEIVDVSDPMHPDRTGHINVVDYAYDAAVNGEYIYIASGRDGLMIFDISDPRHPAETGAFNTGSVARSVAADEKYVYVADCDEGLYIIDNRIPSKPEKAASFNTAKTAQCVAITNAFACIADGADGLYVIKNEVITALKEEHLSAGKNIDLEQNYPNPFNPSTNISFSIAEQSYVRLSVYNLIGEKVAELVNEYLAAGHYNIKFNASKNSAISSGLASGIYIYKISAESSANRYIMVKKMIFLK
jgi:hypothetical protein